MAKKTKGKKIVVHVSPEIADLVPGFLERRRKEVRDINEALRQGDFETILVIGHTMRGAASSYGFDGVVEIGETLGDAAKKRDEKAVRGLVNKLAWYLEHLEVHYD